MINFNLSFKEEAMAKSNLAPQKHLFDVVDFYNMADFKSLENKRIELLEGEVVDMGQVGKKHAYCVDLLSQQLSRALSTTTHIVRVQNPIRLSKYSEPQPDIAILKRSEKFWQSHPEPKDVLLVIEIADHSLKYDKTIKIPVYARYGICEVWIVDLENKRVECYTSPHSQMYAYQKYVNKGESVSPSKLPEISLPVSEFIGK